MKKANIYEAKAKLSEIVAAVLAGEEWVIAKSGEPLVILVPFKKTPKKLTLGAFKKKIKYSEDFDQPLSEEDLASWYDGEIFPSTTIEKKALRSTNKK
jgi:prevent-host-death family protein